MATYQIKINQDTVFKQSVIDSSKLTADKKINIKAGQEFTLLAYIDLDNSWKITLKDLSFAPPGSTTSYNTWFVYKGHVTLLDDSPVVEVPRGACFNVEGLKYPIYFDKQIIEGGNLKWSEVLHYNPATGYFRNPKTKKLIDNAIKTANMFEEVRTYLGGYPMTITSGYRDLASNIRAGGSTKSLHMQILALDFTHSKLTPGQVQKKLDPWWKGGLEYSAHQGFSHTDLGGRRRFGYGSWR